MFFMLMQKQYVSRLKYSTISTQHVTITLTRCDAVIIAVFVRHTFLFCFVVNLYMMIVIRVYQYCNKVIKVYQYCNKQQ